MSGLLNVFPYVLNFFFFSFLGYFFAFSSLETVSNLGMVFGNDFSEIEAVKVCVLSISFVHFDNE